MSPRKAHQPASPCFQTFTHTKTVKRLAALRKDLMRPDENRTCRYLAALSFGPSSAALTRMLDENLAYVRSKANPRAPVAYELLVLHVDTDLRGRAPGEVSEAEKLLAGYRERFPGLEFKCVPLGDVLKLRSVDWSALPDVGEGEPAERIRALFDGLPSVTSRADVLRLLIRHLLLAQAAEGGFEALLMGCTTTALAELTLAEVAKGRGFSVPWQINDGPFPIPGGLDPSSGTTPGTIHIYYPLRDVFRKEIHTYLSLCDPPLADLVVSPESDAGAVVSHRDLSIEETMTRYFESVEETYPAVVTNVVRTTGKLGRAETGEGEACSVCGMVVDERGDARWKGEIGAEARGEGEGPRLCYGCERSIHG